MTRASRPTSNESRVRLLARVTPGARQERLTLDPDGTLRVAVRARATEGQANRALCAALAAWLGLPPSAIAVVRGATSRQKVVEILGLDATALAERLRVVTAAPLAPTAASRVAPEAE